MSSEVDLVKLAYRGGLQDWHNRGVDDVVPPMAPGANLTPKPQGAEVIVRHPGVVHAEGALVMAVAVPRPEVI